MRVMIEAHGEFFLNIMAQLRSNLGRIILSVGSVEQVTKSGGYLASIRLACILSSGVFDAKLVFTVAC